MNSQQLQAEADDLAERIAELEARAVQANGDELPSIGGLLAALGVRLKGARERVREALDLEAQAERRKAEREREKQRAELFAAGASLNDSWAQLLRDFDGVAAEAARLWERYESIMHSHRVLSDKLAKHELLLSAGLTVGNTSGALRDAKQGSGVLAWRAKG